MSDRAIEAVILLDRSGSMQERRADHEGGLRSFLREMQTLAGDVRLTFVRFDSEQPCDVAFEGRPVGDVSEDELTLVPRGGTPLLDAVGMTLTRTVARLAVDQRQTAVIVMIITDGEENQSHEWTKARVQALVKEREAHGWRVLYLGANVDEFHEAGGIGIAAGMTLGYANTPHGTAQMYDATARNVRHAATAHLAGNAWGAAAQNLNYTATQRTAVKTNDEEEKTP